LSENENGTDLCDGAVVSKLREKKTGQETEICRTGMFIKDAFKCMQRTPTWNK